MRMRFLATFSPVAIFSRVTTFSLLTVAARSAVAHPGHGNPDLQDGLAHYLTSPLHVGPAVLLVVAGLTIAAVRRVVRGRRQAAQKFRDQH